MNHHEYSDIAIIGISGRFPDAETVGQLFQNLCNGVDSVKPLSKKRIADTSIEEKNYQVFAYLEGIDKFDYQFFDIALGEAQYMDPHQRLLMEVVYETFENAGYDVRDFDGSRTSVYLADTDQQYYHLVKSGHPTLLTGNLNAATAGRIARYYNLTGNAVMVDTACSSSMNALYLACNDLLLKESESALVGAANIILFPPDKDNDDETGIDSPDGRAKAFAASANGTSNGEAVTVLLLKKLDKAIADKDIIHAVIKCVAVNQDGKRSSSLTAPSSVAQAELIERVFRKAKVDAAAVELIEAHGTGTPLGDPIEIEGIRIAFEKFTGRKQFCAISSIKTNIGHTDTAAGLVGLTKLILSLKHKVFFPSLHFDEPNPYIDFMDSPVYVNRKLQAWIATPGQKRLGAVSSFGVSGTNAHAVVEEWIDQGIRSESKGSFLFTVSGGSRESLHKNLSAINDHLVKHKDNSLADLCFTLNTGRKHHAFRYSRIVSSRKDLLDTIPLDLYRNDIYYNTILAPLWLIFAPLDDLDESTLSFILDANPGLHELFDNSFTIHGPSLTISQRSLIFQFALYQFLTTIGITSLKLAGIGSGKLVASVIKGDLNLSEALQLALTSEAEDNCQAATRFHGFVHSNASHDIILFMSPSRNLLPHFVKNEVQGEYRLLDLQSDGKTGNPLLKIIQVMYHGGLNINFMVLYKRSPEVRKIELPVYQFQKTRCWFSETAENDQTNIRDWFYKLEWVKEPLTNKIKPGSTKNILVITDSPEFTKTIKVQLEARGDKCFCIGVPEWKDQIKSGVHDFNKELNVRLETVEVIICAFDLDNIGEQPELELESSLDNKMLFHLDLFKGLSRSLKKGVALICLSKNAFFIDPKDYELSLTAHVYVGMLKALQSEFSQSKIATLDFSGYELASFEIVGNLVIEEMVAQEFYSFAAYRNGERFIQKFDRVAESELQQDTLTLRENGVFVVTGGAQGVGTALTSMLASKTRGTIAVIGKTKLPPSAEWSASLMADETPSEVKSRIANLLEAGKNKLSNIVYYTADVTDAGAVNNIFNDITASYGKINGVFHLAGSTGNRMPLDRLTATDVRATLSAKVKGSLVVWNEVKLLQPDFIVFFSSLNSVVPQLNSIDYTAANAFEDALGAWIRHHNFPSFVMNWGAWGEVGAGRAIDIDSSENSDAVMRAWRTSDGLRALEIAMCNGAASYSIVNLNLNRFPGFPFFRNGQVFDNAEANGTDLENTGISSTEVRILKIWKEVLRKPSISIDDNFFELGGHSLLASRMINMIAKDFEVKLNFKDIFSNQTVREMASFVDRHNDTEIIEKVDPIVAIASSEFYAVSYAQERLWASQNIETQQQSYNIVKAITITGKLNIGALKKAIHTFVARHEIIRSTFHMVNGSLMQKVSPVPAESETLVTEINLRHSDDHRSITDNIIGLDLLEVFDLSTGPLLRVKLIHWNEQQCVLSLAFHHLISDAVSAVIMPAEISQLYNAYSNNKANPLADLHIQYKDYASWIRNRFEGSEWTKERAYWIKQLKDFSLLQLPTDAPRTERSSDESKRVVVVLPNELKNRLRFFSKEAGTTSFVSLLTAIGCLLRLYSKHDDITFGMPVSGRDHPDLEGQLGFYINILPIRLSIRDELTIMQLQQAAHLTLQDAVLHQHYPFDSIASELRQQRKGGRSAMFEIAVTQNFGMQQDERDSIQMTDLKTFEYEIESRVSPYEVNFDINSSDEGILIEYNADLFSDTRMSLMAERLKRLIELMVMDSGITIGNVLQKLEATMDETEDNEGVIADFDFN